MIDRIVIQPVSGSRYAYQCLIAYNGCSITYQSVDLRGAREYAKGFNEALACGNYAKLEITVKNRRVKGLHDA